MDTKQRIAKLVAEGRLSAAEAAGIERFSSELESHDSRAAAPAAGSDPRAEFLRGEIDAATLHARLRRMSLSLGLVLALLLFLMVVACWSLATWGPLSLTPPPQAWLLALGLVLALMSGVVTALVTNLAWAAPRARLLVRYMALVQRPLPALSSTRAGQCPTCGAEHAKTAYAPWVLWNWRYNPGTAVAELALGIRPPRDVSNCLECGSDFVDCQACQRSFTGREWGRQGSFGRWRGLPCPACDTELPAVENVITGVLTAGRASEDA